MDEKTIANNILEKIEELIIDCNEYKKRNKIKYSNKYKIFNDLNMRVISLID